MSDRRQRQKEQRAAKRAAQRKAAQRSELYRRLVTALIFGGVVIGIFLVPSLRNTDDTALPGSYEGFRSQPTACGADQPPPETVMSFEGPERQTDISADSDVRALIETSCGEIIIQLDTAGHPDTVNSFVFLAREGFYDGQVFYRVAEGFKIQGGDPEGNGTGGPGYVIEAEHPDDGFMYERGIVAMESEGARSKGSEFFIIIGDSGRHLTSSFNVLGTVVSGEDTLDRIEAVPKGTAVGTREQSLPLESVYIERITITVAGS